MNPPRRVPLGEVAVLFLRLGLTSFGGPAAHNALMQQEVVKRRGWISQEEFLDLLGAVNLIPGPNSTELAIHIGHRVAGWKGLIVAGVCFILPAALIVAILGWAYVRYGSLPASVGLLRGIQPVIVAIILIALWQLGHSALKSRVLIGLAAVVFVLSMLRFNEVALIFGGGAIALVEQAVRQRRYTAPALSLFVPGLESAAVPERTPVSLSSLFLVFLKIGSVLFGSGYVLLAFLRADFVERRGWLTETQLLDSVAVGQVTPGPVFTTATFIGYILAGPWGAILATVGIFLPAFVFVALSIPLLARLRRSSLARGFLDGVNVASLALMAAVTWQIGKVALADPLSLFIAVVCALLLVVRRVNPTWLVLGGAVLGLLRTI